MANGRMLHSGVRKAYASKGDDCTLCRFVKTKEEPKRTPRKQWQLPGTINGSRSIQDGRSIFYRKGVHHPDNVSNVLVSGHSNVKIGRDVRKGPLRGYWIYTLSLEERRTCPRTCKHWNSCYGNNMPFAKRIVHGRALELALQAEIPRLLAVRKRRGILIRLHALGDFYDTFYVQLWEQLLEKYPRLAVYGYTARLPGTVIGDAILSVKRKFGSRFAIRFSDGGLSEDCTVSIKDASQKPTDAFVCPEQTGATAACATCGLCWGTKRNVAFLEH
jgi:hypothetical protein